MNGCWANYSLNNLSNVVNVSIHSEGRARLYFISFLSSLELWLTILLSLLGLEKARLWLWPLYPLYPGLDDLAKNRHSNGFRLKEPPRLTLVLLFHSDLRTDYLTILSWTLTYYQIYNWLNIWLRNLRVVITPSLASSLFFMFEVLFLFVSLGPRAPSPLSVYGLPLLCLSWSDFC